MSVDLYSARTEDAGHRPLQRYRRALLSVPATLLKSGIEGSVRQLWVDGANWGLAGSLGNPISGMPAPSV